MKRLKTILLTLLSATMLFGCGKITDSTVMTKSEDTVAEEASNDAIESPDNEEPAAQDTYKEVRLVSLTDSYDSNDDLSLQNGMWTELKDEAAEKEFLSFFTEDPSSLEVIEYTNSKVYMGTEGEKNIFVALIGDDNLEYPVDVYSFKYSPEDYKVEAKYDASKTGDELYDSIIYPDGSEYTYIDIIKPLLDYQEKEEFKDDNGEVVKVKYHSDPYTYGTYNSSGNLYFDSKGLPVYRDYYRTDGRMFSYYIYNDKDELVQIIDFGGNPFKGLEGNDDIAIGVDFVTYIFER